MSDSYELLERVNDRDSLIAFVEAFIAERESAETLEREQPHRYAMGGALDWQNSDISSFLDGACQFLHHQCPGWCPANMAHDCRDSLVR